MGARPYVDQPVRGREQAFELVQRLASDWGLPPPIEMRHGMNSLYRCGEVVVRVGATTAPADRSHALATWLLDAGVPTVRPVAGLTADVDGLAATAWEYIVPTTAPVDWGAIGRAVRTVHSLSVDQVPEGYPVADPLQFPWWDFEALLVDVEPDVDVAAMSGLGAALDRAAGFGARVAAGPVLCHGDVHPGNVLVSAEHGSLLIDWDLLCGANPAWDHAMLTTYADRWGGNPDAHRSFLEGYGDPPVDAHVAATLGELRNVAATLMRVKAGRTDPAAAEEAQRRLRFWRGAPDAPIWQAQ